MGAISRHCDIEAAAIRAFVAGEDMMLICAHPEVIRRGYHALLQTAQAGRLPEGRVGESLKRIADIKEIAKEPLPLDLERFRTLSDETIQLNEKLNYTYGGAVL